MALGKKIKSLVLKLYGDKCWYCQTKLTLATMTIDHYEPRALGGSDHIDNLRPSCQRCNVTKGKQRWLDKMSETNKLTRGFFELEQKNIKLSEELHRQKIETGRWKKIASHYSEVIRILTKKFNKQSLEQLIKE